MLTIVTYWWGEKYGPEYVERLQAGMRRFLHAKHDFICVTDRAGRTKPAGARFVVMPDEDLELTKIQGCFARLRLFDLAFQEQIDARDVIVSVDLDAVVVNSMDPLFEKPEPFRILQGINTNNLCPFNGSLFAFRRGFKPEIWSEFSMREYIHRKVPYHEFPDDQGWLHHMVPGAAAYGPNEGVYGFKKKGWPSGDGLPLGARYVCFPGWRDPSRFVDSVPWIRQNWRA